MILTGRQHVRRGTCTEPETLCVQEERVVGNDNCASFLNRTLQILQSPLRPQFVRATVKRHLCWLFSNCAMA